MPTTPLISAAPTTAGITAPQSKIQGEAACHMKNLRYTFYMDERGQIVTPSYDELGTPETSDDRLQRFLEQRLTAGLLDIIERHSHINHKSDLFDLGRVASALLMETGAWMAEAQRMLTEAIAEEMRVAHLQREAQRAVEGARGAPPAEVARAAAKQRVAALQRDVDRLRHAREDLGKVLSFVQSGMRSLREEEMLESD